ncbi:MAG: hypothetical protein HOP09_12590 [Hyphomicrobium sp.]|nr:hypothetical protein [Hyphomicrobium sp.]
MQTFTVDPRTVVVTPAVIAAALDCLVAFDHDPISPGHMHLIAQALGCREPEATALTLRLLATADVLNDRRWVPWSQLTRTMSRGDRQQFDRMFLLTVSSLPLDDCGRFDADAFFGDLLFFAAVPDCVAAADVADHKSQ